MCKKCGCNTCETKITGPLLTESKVKSLLSENLQFHIDENIPLSESKLGLKSKLLLLKEAKKLYSRNILDLSKDDKSLMETYINEKEYLKEKIKGLDGKACWKGYKYAGTKKKGGKTVDNCVPMEEDMDINELMEMEIIDENITEAKYQGKTVDLNKPTRGDSKKFKVYVNTGKKNADGSIKVKKVNFGHGGTTAKKAGQKTMSIRKSNPKARSAFRARHNCSSPGPKTMARYWSCKKW
tara:strand:+ start:1446 stop:2162 length:717 start_codon:yes stop_codon:yes gene_type:complete